MSESDLKPSTPYIPVPVSAAKSIAEQFAKSIVIVIAHDAVHGLMHTSSYGTDPDNKAWAAQGAEIARQALGGALEGLIPFEDYRLEQAQRLYAALQDAVAVIRTWHGMGARGQVEQTVWDLYFENAPEMKPIREALDSARQFLKSQCDLKARPDLDKA